MRDETREDLLLRTDAERGASISIPHYDWYRTVEPLYERRPILSRRCQVAIARIRMGYRSLWEVANRPLPDHTVCKLCQTPNSRTLIHYIVDCPSIAYFRPPAQSYRSLCDYFINQPNILEDILTAFPDFL
ncbi:MAG: hypothetical protein GY938_13400, partial [Ketobacter sp.]|nr:hypothetical protein [Ketobacter sp.]